jgi:hypothetical protein
VNDTVGNKIQIRQSQRIVVDQPSRKRRKNSEAVVFKFRAKFLSPDKVEDDAAQGLDGVVGNELEQKRVPSEAVNFQVANVARARARFTFRRGTFKRREFLELRAVIFRARRAFIFPRLFGQIWKFRFVFLRLHFAAAKDRSGSRIDVGNWRENRFRRSRSALKSMPDPGKRCPADTDSIPALESSIVDLAPML